LPALTVSYMHYRATMHELAIETIERATDRQGSSVDFLFVLVLSATHK
jgi:hypothetical protein